MSVSVHWFRSDLRLSDNPALTTAARSGQIVCLYILDDADDRPPAPNKNACPPQTEAIGAASRVWLHDALWSEP